jgi:hypothetical protein
MPVLIKKATTAGAHALMLVDGQLFFGPNYGSRGATIQAPVTTGRGLTAVNRFLPESFRPGVSVLAIRWVQGAPPGLPAKYASLAPTYKPGAKPIQPKVVAEPKTTKPAPPKKEVKPAVPAPKQPAPKTNIVPANPATTPDSSSTSTNKPAAPKKTAKPDEAR